MDVWPSLIQGFSVALTPLNLLLALAGAFLGTIIGMLPGLGPVNGVAILIPLAFTLGLAPVSALILLTAIYYGAMFGGRISSILLNIPGDEPAVITTLDGYPMAQQGKASAALAISAIASFVGGTIATIGLTLFAPILATVAMRFGPAEYFALFVLAFATVGGVGGSSTAKKLLAALIGLMLATIGLDPVSGIPRFTFGSYELYDGIDFIVALVGIFALSEFLFFMENPVSFAKVQKSTSRVGVKLKEITFSFFSMIRGSVIGFISGVLPGAGASLGSLISYTFEKRVSDKEGTFGKGDPRGVAAPEAGNNAAAAGALVPMLTLGVPGSGTTAVLLALLISLNITPGPLLFQQQPDVVWGLIAALYLGNVMLLILNLPLIGLFTRMLSVPHWVLMPIVIVVSFLGVYAINHSPFDLLLMTGFGIAGYLLRKIDIPLVPLVIGLLLGNHMEFSLRRALSISGGDWSILLGSPLAVSLWIGAAVVVIVSTVFERRPGRDLAEKAIEAE